MSEHSLTIAEVTEWVKQHPRSLNYRGDEATRRWVHSIGLPTRVANVLLRYGIVTAEEIAATEDELLLTCHNLGKKGLVAIREVIPYLGPGGRQSCPYCEGRGWIVTPVGDAKSE